MPPLGFRVVAFFVTPFPLYSAPSHNLKNRAAFENTGGGCIKSTEKISLSCNQFIKQGDFCIHTQPLQKMGVRLLTAISLKDSIPRAINREDLPR